VQTCFAHETVLNWDWVELPQGLLQLRCDWPVWFISVAKPSLAGCQKVPRRPAIQQTSCQFWQGQCWCPL